MEITLQTKKKGSEMFISQINVGIRTFKNAFGLVFFGMLTRTEKTTIEEYMSQQESDCYVEERLGDCPTFELKFIEP